MLQRITVDADLRWHMLHTEAFARLCIAEAQRTGEQPETVERQYSALQAHCMGDRPKLVLYLRVIDDLREACKKMLDVISKHYPNDWQGIRMQAHAAISLAEEAT